MPKKTIVGEFEGNRFSVENTWFSGAQLFQNGALIAASNDTFALKKSEPMMTAKVVIEGSERIVEVFAFALLTVKPQIRIDGKKIAGDEL